MKSGKFFLSLFLCLFFLVSACRDEKGKNDYSGVSELISDRNKARFEAVKNLPKKKGTLKKTTINKRLPKPESTSKTKALSSIVLYEQDVEIISSKSGRALAKGVAYINKQGQIVKIKILKE